MARWKLEEAHYLFGHPPDLEEVEWEYKETDRVNGRERRKRFKVPFYFEAETIVCYEGKGQRDDCVFEGTPTPAMQPLDDEAKEISAKYSGQWIHPIESLSGQGFSASLLSGLERQLAELTSKMPAPTTVVESGVSREEFENLQAQFAALMAQNAELQAAKTETPARRV
jgi:hypothetical protein